jgi:TRAP-type C4-dicarboxylate transport system substrate-binding protein
MKGVRGTLWALLAFLLAGGCLSGQTIKLGTLAPAGSPWHESLLELASEWRRISEGAVRLKIYPGGIAGDERDMIRKMRIGQLQAAGITAFGLTHIHRDIGPVLLPFLIGGNEELAYVLDRIMPFYESVFRERGFQLVMWVMMGWTYVFAREPVRLPDDLRRQKLWVRAGDADEIAAWQKAGFRVVPLSASEIMSSLTSGMTDAVVVSPLAAAAGQWFGIASNMCDLKVSPFVGAVVVSKRAWERIPAKWREPLLQAARAIAMESMRQILEADRQAVEVMRKHGLTVHSVPTEAEDQWRSTMTAFSESLAGRSFSLKAYRTVSEHVAAFRQR